MGILTVMSAAYVAIGPRGSRDRHSQCGSVEFGPAITATARSLSSLYSRTPFSVITCYCAPTSMGMMIYGLIVIFHSDSARAFELAEKGGYSPTKSRAYSSANSRRDFRRRRTGRRRALGVARAKSQRSRASRRRALPSIVSDGREFLFSNLRHFCMVPSALMPEGCDGTMALRIDWHRLGGVARLGEHRGVAAAQRCGADGDALVRSVSLGAEE